MRKRPILVFLCLQTLITINSIKPALAITKSQQQQQQSPFNLSRFLYPILHDDFRPPQSLFLQDVVDTICVSQGWDPDDVRVSELEVGNVGYGNVGRYEISIVQDGKRRREFLFRFSDHPPVKWAKFVVDGGGDVEFESLAEDVSASAVLDVVKIEGPVELRVGGDDRFQLMLPLNSSHSGLKSILVGEGMTVEVRSAQEVSLFHSSGFSLRSNTSVVIHRGQAEPWSFGQQFCLSLLPVNILGSASVIAYRTQNPDSYIDYKLLTAETIELLPDKCCVKQTWINRGCPINSLKIKMAFLEEILRSLSDDKTRQSADFRLLKAKIRVSTVFRFKLELERDIRSNDTLWSTLADWKTRPTMEHAWFEIVARNEAKRLKPVLIKKVRPFVGVETSPWSNLMSNLSFTKIPSVLVPPEAMTLDVKW